MENVERDISTSGVLPPPHPLLIPEILLQVGPYLSQATVYHCVLVCRTWNACLTPHLFQRVSLPKRQLLNGNKRRSRPMISALQRNASHIRVLVCADNNVVLRQITPQCTGIETLVIGKITLEVLPILQLCKDTLVQLEFTPAHHVQLYSSHSGSNERSLQPKDINEVLKAISNLSKLKHLVLTGLRVKDSAQLQLLFEYCQQLSSLELRHTSVYGAAPSSLMFNEMRTLSLVECPMPITDQLMLVMQCPFLDHLTWIRQWNTIPIESLGPLMEVGRRELKSLDISRGNRPDTDTAMLLESLPSLKTLIACETPFGPISLRAILDNNLKDQIQVLHLMDCSAVTPMMVNQIMTSCPGLKSLSADRLLAIDVIDKDGLPWVCRDLEELRVVFVGPLLLSSYETQHAVYSKIATLRRLRLLNLGQNENRMWNSKSVLDLSLANGLGQLAPLRELEEFDFCEMNHRLGMDEFKFMLRYWRNLRTLHGRLNADKDREEFIRSFLRNERPGIRLKRSLKNRRGQSF
ncbi:hypothetical protein EDD21DRAFT_382826, partial [Dissophora ornata]